MTDRANIIKMAREAGWPVQDSENDDEWLETAGRFAALARAAEREECAKVAEGWECDPTDGDYMTCGNGSFWDAGTDYDQGRADAAAAIRNRGKAAPPSGQG